MLIYLSNPKLAMPIMPIWCQSVHTVANKRPYCSPGSLKWRFVHQHKGKKPKRGNPRRQPLFSFR